MLYLKYMENYLEINYENNMKMLSDAIKYCEENFLHEEIIKELSSDNDIKKQLCLIELKKVDSQSEADILVSNLTGKSGPIRETAAVKIQELIFMAEFNNYFQTKEIIMTFVKAITDINPSVSRSAVEIIKYVDDIDFLYEKIIAEIKVTLSNIDENVKNRSYVQNKKNFNLYWNLEAIISLSEKVLPKDDLLEILTKTAKSNDYTIREKTAKAAMIFSLKDEKFKQVLDLLKNDDNIYVKKYLA